METKVNYSFNQVETALIAFIGNIELKLQAIISEIPVFVIETGDTSYYLDNKFKQTDNKEIYQKIPRVVLSIKDSPQLNIDENTNQYNNITYKFGTKLYTAVCRRVALNLNIDISFVTSNFIEMLSGFEILQSLFSRDNVLTYQFMGNTYESAFSNSSVNVEMPTMDIGGNTRNVVIKVPVELQIQLIVPRVETIKESRILETQFHIVQHDGHEELFRPETLA